jgi:hypothetical protein
VCLSGKEFSLAGTGQESAAVFFRRKNEWSVYFCGLLGILSVVI